MALETLARVLACRWKTSLKNPLSSISRRQALITSSLTSSLAHSLIPIDRGRASAQTRLVWRLITEEGLVKIYISTDYLEIGNYTQLIHKYSTACQPWHSTGLLAMQTMFLSGRTKPPNLPADSTPNLRAHTDGYVGPNCRITQNPLPLRCLDTKPISMPPKKNSTRCANVAL